MDREEASRRKARATVSFARTLKDSLTFWPRSWTSKISAKLPAPTDTTAAEPIACTHRIAINVSMFCDLDPMIAATVYNCH